MLKGVVVFVAAAVASPAALACGIAPSFSLIHAALPEDVPSNAFVARVIIEDSKPNRLYGQGLKAIVLQVLKGEAHFRKITLKASGRTSCDMPFFNGREGIIVGMPRKAAGRQFILEPVMVDSTTGFRLLGKWWSDDR